jgi:hypothetical protein
MCLQHAGIHGVVNPGEAVFMESGENLVQWRKLFFCQYGVSMQHSTFLMCLTTDISPLEIMPKLTSICLHLQSLFSNALLLILAQVEKNVLLQ